MIDDLMISSDGMSPDELALRKRELDIMDKQAENDKQAIALQRVPGPGMGHDRGISFEKEQLEFLYNTQPKKQDIKDNIGWEPETLITTEILRHIQLSNVPQQMADAWIREFKDCQILLQQHGRQIEAKNALQALYLRILIQKSVPGQGRPTDRELLQTMTTRQTIEQKMPEEPRRKVGFFGQLLGRS
jgi:hypothetical protein